MQTYFLMFQNLSVVNFQASPEDLEEEIKYL